MLKLHQFASFAHFAFGSIWLLQILTRTSEVHCDQLINILDFNLKTRVCIPLQEPIGD